MLELEDDIFGNLEDISQEELGADFDQLVAISAQQPDDAETYEEIKKLVVATYERGDIERVQQMAMVLGAMACMDSHFEDIANEAAGLTEQHGKDDGHDHNDGPSSTKHDGKTCKDCKAGRTCKQR